MREILRQIVGNPAIELVPGTRGDILVLSMRRVANLAANCLQYEFEDITVDVTGADRADPTRLELAEFERRVYKALRKVTSSAPMAMSATTKLGGLRLKKTGNALMELVGGRAIHPVNVKVGGFWSLPDPEEMAAVRRLVETALDDALATVRDVARFEVPDVEQPHTYLSLRTPDAYPIENGSIVTSEGSAFAVDGFFEHVVEEHVPHSHALHARLHGAAGPYAGAARR